MNCVFPCGFPGPTAFYLAMYVGTLILHVIFMNYVLAGTAALVVTARSRADGGMLGISDVLRDWMPFALSLAITAAIAPLLFLQILYKANFYSANILLFHRWMAILPVLIVGFYLLYLLKTKWIAGRSPVLQVLVGLLALGCFGFTAASWTENHLLSLDAAAWPRLYESGRLHYEHPQFVSRLIMLGVGSVPTMCLLVGWQLYAARRMGSVLVPGRPRRLMQIAIAGEIVAVFAGAYYLWNLPADAKAHLKGWLGGPYLALATLGIAIQVYAWVRVARREEFAVGSLLLCSTGLLLTLIGMTVTREVIRLSFVDISQLFGQHAEAARKGGMLVFLAFFVLNGLLIIGCVRLVRRNASRPDPMS